MRASLREASEAKRLAEAAQREQKKKAWLLGGLKMTLSSLTKPWSCCQRLGFRLWIEMFRSVTFCHDVGVQVYEAQVAEAQKEGKETRRIQSPTACWKLVVTSASLLVTSALLVVTRSYRQNNFI